MEKHIWTKTEDLYCCLACLVYAMEGKGNDVRPLYEELCTNLPHIKPGSIHMKMQNIKQLFEEHRLKYVFAISPLKQYSIQCEKAFTEALYSKGGEKEIEK